ncbi:MAG: DUF5317 family protein [Acidimicrobiales bacterium]
MATHLARGSGPGLRLRPGQIGAVIVAVLLQLTAVPFDSLARALVPASFVLGMMAAASVCWTSCRQVVPTALVALGAAANAAPIIRYGAMPVDPAARAVVSNTPIREPGILAAKHQELAVTAHWSDPISLLIDRIPLPFGHAVISVGDIVLLAGFIALGIGLRLQPRDDRSAAEPA